MFRNLRAALAPLALFILALPPILIGAVILVALARGQVTALTPPNDLARLASYPWAITLHVLGGAAILTLGLAQFSARLRRRWPAWHRWAGRAILAGGAGTALSGLWMNAAPLAAPSSALHDGAQNVMAAAFLVVAALGLGAARRRDFSAHRAWMMRAYAIAMGAGTQTAMLFPVYLIHGAVEGLAADLAFVGAWAVNLALAEVLVRRRDRARAPLIAPLRPLFAPHSEESPAGLMSAVRPPASPQRPA